LRFLARHPIAAADAAAAAETAAEPSAALLVRLASGWAANDPLAAEPIAALLAAHAPCDTPSSPGSSSRAAALVAAVCGHLDVAGAEPLPHEALALNHEALALSHEVRDEGASRGAGADMTSQTNSAWRTLALLLVDADAEAAASNEKQAPGSVTPAWMVGREVWWPHALLALRCVDMGSVGGAWRGRRGFLRRAQRAAQVGVWTADACTAAAAKAAVAARFAQPSASRGSRRLPAAAVVGAAFVLAVAVEAEEGRQLLVRFGFPAAALAALEAAWRANDAAHAARRAARREAKAQPPWAAAAAQLLATPAWRQGWRKM
jgi:hypothetical protein